GEALSPLPPEHGIDQQVEFVGDLVECHRVFRRSLRAWDILLDRPTISQANGHPTWEGPRIDLLDLRIDLEPHLVGQVHQTGISNLVTGELLRTGIAVCQGHGHTVFYVHLRLHGTHRLVPPTGLQLDHAVIRHDDFVDVLRLDAVRTCEPGRVPLACG